MENQASINEWATSVGIKAGAFRSVVRANEEMREALAETQQGDFEGKFDKAIVELADVAICLFVAAERMGKDLQAEIDAKMKINRARQWRLDASGCAYHVK